MTGSTTDVTTSRPQTKPSRPLGWADLGIGVAAAVVLLGLGILLLRALPEDQSILVGLASYAVSGLGPLGAVAVVTLLRRRRWSDFGIRRVAGRWLAVAVGVGVVVIGLNVLVTAVVVTYTQPENIQTDYQAAATGGLASFLGAILLGALLTPFGEEMFFRGLVANVLGRWGWWSGVLLSSAVFAVAHGINVVTPVAFLVGVAAALLLRRTGSIWPAVVVHVCNNVFSVVVPAVIALTA
ncbi:CPBP family intramembrane metalloprotease [Desertihabitans brevis]|uniref:CPBP family intramembrane metalloprotease n=1 Tax=Desertihabitans brevis TaxID=2268447 RepID=A0A367YT84_9ACTN|nr:type II CAAX endopeptidase family protein [Desertihabitans brevis]RCK68749.1 CPBP family intramembrane metalloprotease [Desertihabitans brevis]